MKKILFAIAILFCAAQAHATSYYLATAAGGGSDSNNGTSTGTPWLSPNHALNCGDTITAAASTSYSATNFASGKWGTVTCSGNNNVAWLQCVSFDGCKISASGTQAMEITASYWGVEGWETAGSGSNASCFEIRPPNSSTSIHHIIFANDIANGCIDGGFTANNNGSAGVDYIVYIGNIAYNAAQASDVCASGFNIYQPKKSDSASGTHMYVAGNFAWANLDPDPCAGGLPTDGEGIILDTFDGTQGSGNVYDQQSVVYNNISIDNGGRGVLVLNNNSGSGQAPMYIEYNTSWGNDSDPNQNGGGSYGDIEASRSYQTTISNNLSMTNAATCCGGYALFAYFVNQGNGTVTASSNWGYSAAGHNGGTASSTGFSYGTNAFGTSPSFASATAPGAPSCGSATSVPNCMATVIANFTPSASGSTAYGYQPVSNTSRVDALYPAWLCSVTIPLDLVTPGCGSLTPPTISPLNPVLTPSGTQTFTCSANCGTSPRWTCPTCTEGNINSSTGVYTANSTIASKQSVGGYQLLPNDHIFNTNISGLPAASNSATIIAGAGTVPLSFDPAFPVNYVNGSTPTGTLTFTYTPTNNGTYQFPLWPQAGIEGGWFGAFNNGSGDHHMINVDTTDGNIDELYQPVGLNSACSPCNAASGLKYTTEDYTLPVNGATDAAGMFLAPLTVKSQEFVNAVQTGGSINHATRMTLSNGYICGSSTAGACPVGSQQNASGTRHIWPATTEAFAGSGIIPYGTCFRLKSSFNISTFSAPAQILLTELKNYCMFLADGGTGWQLSFDFDNLPATEGNALFEIFNGNIAPSNFEAVDLSSLEESSTSGAVTSGEAACYTSSTGTTCTNVNVQGTAVNINTNQEYFMQSNPQLQLISYPSSGVTWSCVNCTGTIQLAGTATGNNYQSTTGTSVTTASPTPYVTGPINSTTGDFVDVIVYALDFGNPTSVTDVCGNTYTHATAADFRVPGSAPFYVSHWYSIGITGCSSNVWTATWGSNSEWLGIQAREYNPGGATITLGSIPTPVTIGGSAVSTITTGTFNTSANAVVIATASTQFGGYVPGKVAGFPAGNLLGMQGSAAFFLGSQDALISNAQTGITASMNISNGAAGSGMSVLVFSGTGGSSVYGTLTSGGLFTAPSSLISTVQVPVTITSTSDSSVTAQMNLFITPSTLRIIQSSAGDYIDSTGNTWSSGGQLGFGLSNSPQLAGCCQTNGSFANVTNRPLWWTHITSAFNANDRKMDFHVPAGLYQITYNYGTVEPSGSDLLYLYLQGNLLGGGAIDPAAVAGGQALPYTLNVSGQVGSNNVLSFYAAGTGLTSGGPGDVSSISLKAVQPAVPVGLATKGVLLGVN